MSCHKAVEPRLTVHKDPCYSPVYSLWKVWWMSVWMYTCIRLIFHCSRAQNRLHLMSKHFKTSHTGISILWWEEEPYRFCIMGSRSKPILVFCLWNLVGTSWATVFAQSLPNFICKLFMIRGGILLIFGHWVNINFCQNQEGKSRNPCDELYTPTFAGLCNEHWCMKLMLPLNWPFKDDGGFKVFMALRFSNATHTESFCLASVYPSRPVVIPNTFKVTQWFERRTIFDLTANNHHFSYWHEIFTPPPPPVTSTV